MQTMKRCGWLQDTMWRGKYKVSDYKGWEIKLHLPIHCNKNKYRKKKPEEMRKVTCKVLSGIE
jgi:hypothetical protein